jgi:regulator of sigma E protease
MVIVIFIIGISFLILFHEFGHFLAAKMFGRWVEEFGIGFPPRLLKKKIGETIYSINALPFGGFVRIHGEKPESDPHEDPMAGRSFSRLPISKRAVVIGAGVVMNFLAGWVLLSIVFMAGTPPALLVTEVAEGSPAASQGIEAGDRILGFDSSEAFIDSVQKSAGEEIAINVSRKGEEIKVLVTPRVNPPEGQGALGVKVADVGSPKLSFFESIGVGLMASVRTIGAIFVSLANLLTGIFTGGPALEGFVGPVGIFGVANEAAEFGLAYLFQLIALISLNLTVLNIIPIPALDGGRLLFLLFEKIKGSPLKANREAMANAIGFGVLILLMIVITVRDVAKLF